MALWPRFIAWIDRDLGDQDWPDVGSWSSLVPFVPLVLVLPPLWYFDPPAEVRFWIVGIAALPAALLFAVRMWRVFLATRRHLRGIAKRED